MTCWWRSTRCSDRPPGERPAFVNRSLYIIGCGGFGREVFILIQALRAAGYPWDVAGFIDDEPSDLDRYRVSRLGSSYIGTVTELARRTAPFSAVVAIGSSAARVAIIEKLEAAPGSYPNLAHPSCTVGSDVIVGPGTIIATGARLSTNITVGAHVQIDQNATVGHDSEIQAFARINPQACVSGSTIIGERAVIGAGAVVLQGLRIGNNCVVAAAACVVKSVSAGRTVMGVPAR
jgi:sugar O-acyltransferase (sialic acid O-acetyltransferase NeuD family)